MTLELKGLRHCPSVCTAKRLLYWTSFSFHFNATGVVPNAMCCGGTAYVCTCTYVCVCIVIMVLCMCMCLLFISGLNDLCFMCLTLCCLLILFDACSPTATWLRGQKMKWMVSLSTVGRCSSGSQRATMPLRCRTSQTLSLMSSWRRHSARLGRWRRLLWPQTAEGGL